MTELALLPATEQRRLARSGQVSARDLVTSALDQLKAHNGELNAVVTVNERALDDASALDEKAARGEDPGLLYGLTAGIKDITEVAGLRTTYGSELYRDSVADEDALIVERLRRAGAVILGKTNTPEFATGGNTFNEVFGRTLNPWNPDRSAGGSTGGGAAALVRGIIALAEGTDLGGSLRIPASFCGVVGLRPSPGFVPTWPSSFLWDSYQVTGGMARTARDLALMLQAVAGPDPRSPMAQPMAGRDLIAAVDAATLRGRKVAYCPDFVGIGIDGEVEAVCRRAAFALEDRGAIVEEIDFDLSWAWQPFLAIRGYWMLAQQHHRLEHIDGMGDNLAGNIRRGLDTGMGALGAAEQIRSRLWREMVDFFGRFDHLLTPTMAVPPFPVTENYPSTVGGREMETYIDWVAPTFVLSLTGLPVASVPAGFDPSGLPCGLQIVAPPRGEEKALATAALIHGITAAEAPPLP
ncbi:MAG: amidase family protein [Acidobacteriota bacterium]